MGDQEPSARPLGRVRRAPKFGAFILTGTAVGALILGVIAVFLDAPPTFISGPIAAIGYFAALGGLAGGVIGAIVAVLADRRS